MRIAKMRIQDWKSFRDTGDIELGQINVLVGPNNSGKSAILRALGLMQDGMPYSAADLRMESPQAEVTLELEDIADADLKRHFGNVQANIGRHFSIRAKVEELSSGGQRLNVEREFPIGDNGVARVSPILPNDQRNFIYPYFAKRRASTYDGNLDTQRTQQVAADLSNLPAKILRISYSGYTLNPKYTELCEDILGFQVGVYAAETNNNKVGISIGRHRHIAIEDMGDGVPNILGLITNLCMADRHLFLIEEPENDIHPEALKKLLRFIVEQSENSQFIITTHSNVVVRNLGADARLFQVKLAMVPNAVPTSVITPIENTPAARIEVLRELGYDLYDSDLYEGWLILEESSAETIIRGYLIPWFVPRLARIRTVAGGGVSKVKQTFEAFQKLFLFLHLEQQYQGRAWVVLDGDGDGTDVVNKLRDAYANSWDTEEHFRNWNKGDFEEYYPAHFSERVNTILNLEHDAKRQPKRELLAEVQKWCDANRDEAKDAFEDSAIEVIEFLREIDQKLFGPTR